MQHHKSNQNIKSSLAEVENQTQINAYLNTILKL